MKPPRGGAHSPSSVLALQGVGTEGMQHPAGRRGSDTGLCPGDAAWSVSEACPIPPVALLPVVEQTPTPRTWEILTLLSVAVNENPTPTSEPWLRASRGHLVKETVGMYYVSDDSRHLLLFEK